MFRLLVSQTFAALVLLYFVSAPTIFQRKKDADTEVSDLVAAKVAEELAKREKNMLAHLSSFDPVQRDAVIAALNRSGSPPKQHLDSPTFPDSKKVSDFSHT